MCWVHISPPPKSQAGVTNYLKYFPCDMDIAVSGVCPDPADATTSTAKANTCATNAETSMFCWKTGKIEFHRSDGPPSSPTAYQAQQQNNAASSGGGGGGSGIVIGAVAAGVVILIIIIVAVIMVRKRGANKTAAGASSKDRTVVAFEK